MAIYVCDALMGSGKSQSVITYINEHPEKRYIYVTPYLDEAERIRTACDRVDVYEPPRSGRGSHAKTLYTEGLVHKGLSVASTHQAFIRYPPTLTALIREKHYTLIIDENLSPLQPAHTTEAYVRTAVDAGYINEIQPDVFRIADREKRGNLSKGLFDIMQTHDLLLAGKDGAKRVFYWLLPPDLLTSFDDVFILTYMFEGQGLAHMLEMYGLTYTKLGITYDVNRDQYRFDPDGTYVPAYTKNIKSMIQLVDNDKLNAIGDEYYALSKQWFSKPESDIKKLRNNLENYFRHLCVVPPNQRLWTTFENDEAGEGPHKMLAAKGYSSSFIACNTRATNTKSKTNVLAYAANLFPNVAQEMLYQSHGIQTNGDLYALSTLVQWVWRGAIRNGQRISLYLPSRRMRELFQNWMEDLEQGRDPKERILQTK